MWFHDSGAVFRRISLMPATLLKKGKQLRRYVAFAIYVFPCTVVMANLLNVKKSL